MGMELESLIALARDQGASDLHLEPGLPVAIRVRGALRVAGDPVPAQALLVAAQELVGEEQWGAFLERRSHDCSRTIQGVRCRINVLQSSRGVGLAIRLLASFPATLERLNLHPDLRRLVDRPNGLVLICGQTGSGKSSTLAALIQEINLSEARHVITVESPIEYFIRPRKAFVRQREVGRDTPSFEQGLMDALREDPDVIMVGEIREPETMRLTLNAAETGHLVLTTVHSATCVEALQRIVSAFAPETQAAVAAQLADVLVGVVAQRLEYRPDLKIRVPECEVLVPTNPVKAHLRSRELFRIASVLETGADAGMWTWDRYRRWLRQRSSFWTPGQDAESPDTEAGGPARVPPPPVSHSPQPGRSAVSPASGAPPGSPPAPSEAGRRIEIEPVEGGLEGLFRKLH